MKEPYFTILYLSMLALTGIGISIYKNRKYPHLLKRIAAGHLLINVPAFALCLGLPALIFFSVDHMLWRIALMIIAFVGGLTLAWVHWSIFIPKWRVWAFHRLDEEDLLQLERLAVAQRLLWPQGHIFENTELRSKKDKEKINETSLHLEFLKEVEGLKVELGLREITIYPIRRRHIYLEAISKAFLLMVVGGCIITGQYIIGAALLAAILLMGDNKTMIHNLQNKSSAVQLNQTGILIQLRDASFYNWGELYMISLDRVEEELVLELSGSKKVRIKLVDFQIDDYEKMFREMKAYLHLYVKRREKLSGSLN